MARNQQTNKRRVAAEQRVARQQAAVAKAERRRRIIVGAIVGFLALALIAPLTAGLIADDDPVEVEELPTTTTSLDLPWAAGEQAGATLTGPTPCPATDGSETRTTEFAEAPPVCIEPDTVYELTFETAAGSFTLPIDSGRDVDAANLAAVLAWYGAYEQTPVIATTGGLWIGSPGDAGFTVDATPPDEPAAELYPVGTVVAVPALTSGVAGALMVVLDESGSQLLQADPRHVPLGTIDDLSAVQAVFDAPEAQTTLEIDAVTVTALG